MARLIQVADLFCGAGGTTTGLLQAADALGFKLRLTAVNHWPIAIQTHAHNHPWATHFCASLQDIDLSTIGGLNIALNSLDPRKELERLSRQAIRLLRSAQ